MSESDELFSEVAQMRDELEEQGGMINALVRASSREVSEALLADLQSDQALREIFLLVDGKRSQGQIVKHLADRKIKGSSAGSVSKKIDRLRFEGLIVRVRRTRSGIIYRKNARLDQALGITRSLNS